MEEKWLGLILDFVPFVLVGTAPLVEFVCFEKYLSLF